MASSSGILADPDPDVAKAHAQFTASLQIIGFMTVGGTFYGFMTATAALCAHSLVKTRHSCTLRRLAFFLAYIGALWIAGTVLIVAMSGVCVSTFVIHASSSLDSPYMQVPGPGGCTLVSTTNFWIILMLSDGMMVWRLKVVWSTSRFYRSLIAVPVVLYLVASTLGFFSFILFNDRPITGVTSVRQYLFTAMFMSSFCLNIYVTALVTGRLFLYRRRFKANWGLPDTKHYTTMGSILIESYLPQTICTVIYLVMYLLDNPTQYMLTSILGQVQIIAPLVVMLRVSRGVAWNSSTTPRSVESAIDRALDAHEQQMVQTVV